MDDAFERTDKSEIQKQPRCSNLLFFIVGICCKRGKGQAHRLGTEVTLDIVIVLRNSDSNSIRMTLQKRQEH